MPAPHTPTYANTVPVMERHRFDAGSLDRYLHAHLDDYRGGLEVRQFDSGPFQPDLLRFRGDAGRQAPGLRAAQEAAGQAGRLGPPGRPRVPRDLGAGRRPTCRWRPPTCSAPTTPSSARCSISWTAVPGRILIDAAMPDQTPAERAAIFDSMNDVLARLHKVDPAKVGLGDYGRTGQYIARQVARWSRQYAELKTEDIPAMDKLSAWLPEHIPAERSHHHRAWRLSAGEPDRASQRAAHRGGARLGALDPRPSALRHRLQLPRLPSHRAAARFRHGRLQEARPADRRANTSPPTAGASGAIASRTGTTTSPSRCSGWPPSPRASIAAACRAIRPIPNR